jgi:hypothetical protein
LFFGGIGGWTQGFAFAKQALHLQSILLYYFGDGGLVNYLPSLDLEGWASQSEPLL